MKFFSQDPRDRPGTPSLKVKEQNLPSCLLNKKSEILGLNYECKLVCYCLFVFIVPLGEISLIGYNKFESK